MSSSNLLYGQAARTPSVEGMDAAGEPLPRFEPCGCSGGLEHCVGVSHPDCCGACDEICRRCAGRGSLILVKLTAERPGDEEDQEFGHRALQLDQASDVEIEAASRMHREKEGAEMRRMDADVAALFAKQGSAATAPTVPF